MATVRPSPALPQPGRADRLLLAVFALLLTAATGWLVYADVFPEFRRHQDRFRAEVQARFGSNAARAVATGVQQIWVPEVPTADRCATCHLAVTWRGFEDADHPLRTHPAAILRAHPVERFGCTVCHGGDGWAVDRPRAHGSAGSDDELRRGDLLQVKCNACHRYERETAGLDRINAARLIIETKGCRACHRINGRGGLIGPDLDWTGDKSPDQYDYSHLSGRKSAFRWHAAHFQDPRALVPDTVMPNYHLSQADLGSLALLVMSWRRAPVDARLAGSLPRTDPEPEEMRRLAMEMEKGPGAWFVRTGCYTCHPVSVFGVKSPTPIGPDLSTAAEDAERRFSRPIDEFVRNPVGTMRAVFSRQFMLSADQKEEAIRQLRAAFAAHQSAQAAGPRAARPGR